MPGIQKPMAGYVGILRTSKNIASDIDIGDSGVGKQYDSRDEIFANSEMMKMSDCRLPYIHFQSCVTCYGIYSDTGELKHLAEETLVELFRDSFTQECK